MSEPSEVEESRRVSTQIMSLSTQLIESIERQSTLEKELNQANKIIEGHGGAMQEYEKLKKNFAELEKRESKKDAQLNKLREELRKQKEARTEADSNADKLNHEVEELTASLFDEANNMVADARKASHATELRNAKLVEQLHERDALLETLNLQLRHLKKVIQTLDDDSMASEQVKTLANASDNANLAASLSKNLSSSHGRQIEAPLGPIFSPNITAVRYDLGLYHEFLKFLAVLPDYQDIKDTASDSKLLRRLVNDEIQPVLKLENASGLGWILKRTLVNLMIEGLVAVEPISGLNEMHQYGYASPMLNQHSKMGGNNSNSLENSPATTSNTSTTTKRNHSRSSSMTKSLNLFNYPSDSPPVALREKCAICGECRDDLVEHARLHILKTQSRADDGTVTVNNTFPLCKYCVLKIRQTCEIFAFLRSLKLGAWKLEKVSLTSVSKGDSKEFSQVSMVNSNEDKPNRDSKKENRKTARKSFMAGMNALNSKNTTVTPEVPVSQAGAPTTNIQWAWIQLCRLRSMLHWTHIGIWNVDDCITSKIGPLVINDGSNNAAGKTTTHDINGSVNKDGSSSNETPTGEAYGEKHSQVPPVPSTPVAASEPANNSNEPDTFDFEAGGDTPIDDQKTKTESPKKEKEHSTPQKPTHSPETIQEEKENINEDNPRSSEVEEKKTEDEKKEKKNSSKISESNENSNSSKELLDNLDKLGEQLKEESGTSEAPQTNGNGSKNVNSNTNRNNGSPSPKKKDVQRHRSIKSVLQSDNESASNTEDQYDDAQEIQ
ncbi:hypothetical protein ZYGR_0W00220 [Zygosaccharomyces rouxii]|uniref:GDP/GTP exchange factor Sec2 N-terminal domain-containing protein n=1 Tax=Zygosaccharomyces rouxii TaxID=4956 RepID=A0A1Q3A452_ZYGRO|nr:hypothetical protein ZYGR_0W00220 [Zygosaccharomyces rouxii]